jgi:isoleucyl-tRNA synthetase
LPEEAELVGDAIDAAALKSALEAKCACDLDVDGTRVRLSKDELEVGLAPREGYAARAGKGAVLVLETKITPDLVEEWWAREVVAAVNGLRGDRSLAYEARISLQVWCAEKLRKALENNLAYLKSETLSTEVAFQPLEDQGGAVDGAAGTESFRVDLTP